MYDFMYKATDKATWDAFLAAMPEEVLPSILVDEIGPIVITPAVLDENGDVVDEAVIDLSHHVNLRYLGNDNSVAASLAAGASGVQWIDPDLVSTPARIWAGGMNYWTAPIISEENA